MHKDLLASPYEPLARTDTVTTRSVVVEHILGPLGFPGITAAAVVCIRDDWDFAENTVFVTLQN